MLLTKKNNSIKSEPRFQWRLQAAFINVIKDGEKNEIEMSLTLIAYPASTHTGQNKVF